jgi:thiamine pyrophosphate-dependent acetolactate synthase large subunit-like protein
MDNAHYQETGNQTTATGFGVDIAGMAKAAGFPVALNLVEPRDLDVAVDKIRNAPGPVLVNVKIDSAAPAQMPKIRDGALMKLRFRERLLGQP